MKTIDIWAIFFAQICAIRFHPIEGKAINPKLEVEASAEIADLMLEQYQRRKSCASE